MLALIKCPKCKHVQYISREAAELKLAVSCENEKCEIFYPVAPAVVKVFTSSNN